jgi:hypothetical protein
LLGATIGSSDSASIEQLHEIYFNPNEGLFGVCIGRIERASSLLQAIESEIKLLENKTVRGCEEALNRAVHSHRVQHFQVDVLPPGAIPQPADSRLVDAWQQYDAGVHLLMGTFGTDRRALLYLLAQAEDSYQRVHRVLGDATIGLGGSSASFWLNFREQEPGRNLRQSAYHCYEAARLTARPPSSDGNLEMIVATNDKAFHLTHKTPEMEGCPVSLPELERMLETYGPRPTDEGLGHSHGADLPDRDVPHAA